MNNNEDYLYHYTNLDSLKCILANRTIRLNPLNKMDDLQEEKTSDLKNVGKFIFVSSWTSMEKESIPFWREYTDGESGVRIGLPKMPFSKHRTFNRDFDKTNLIRSSADSEKDNGFETFLNLADLICKNALSPEAWSGNILRKVEYTDDIEKLEPKICFQTLTSTNIDLGLLGTYKNTYWEYQNEWRYVMTFLPWSINDGVETAYVDFKLLLFNILLGKAKPPFGYYDLNIDPYCFEKMEIIASPTMTEQNKIKLYDLLKQYNPTAILKDSELKGKIKY